MPDRKLIDYLPHFMREYGEIKTVTETEQVEVDRLWVAIENAFLDQYIPDATENGVGRWESMLGVSPKDTDTLDVRKFRILTKLNQELPYTTRKLEQALTNLCGVGGYSLNVNFNDFYVEVHLALENEGSYVEVENLLAKMIPANMLTYVKIMFNKHGVLTQFTHTQLAEFTHNQLRREVFE